MSVITVDEAASFCGANAGDQNFKTLHAAAESLFSGLCGRLTLESTPTRKAYAISSGGVIYLGNQPITEIQSVSVGVTDGITLNQGSSDALKALVRITEANLYLTTVGGVNAHAEQAFTLEDAKSIQALADEITVFGKGWTATPATDAAAQPSTELLTTVGRWALRTDNTISIPGTPLVDYRAWPEEGIISVTAEDMDSLVGLNYWSAGMAIVRFTAGYTVATLPADIKGAILELIKYIFDNYHDNATGLIGYTLGDETRTFGKPIPENVERVAVRYREEPV
jgi:hypothetical protein